MTDPVAATFKKLERDLNLRFDAINQWTELAGAFLEDIDRRISALEAKVEELSTDD